jgi:TolB-like protein
MFPIYIFPAQMQGGTQKSGVFQFLRGVLREIDISVPFRYTSVANLAEPTMKTLYTLFVSLLVLFPSLQAGTRFYNYYSEGQRFMEEKDWVRAIGEFKSAVSLEFEDVVRKRTYGTRFIEYYPHREMGVAYYYLGEFENAKKELDLSLDYVDDERTREYLDLARRGVRPETTPQVRAAPSETVEQPPTKPGNKETIDARSTILPAGALTYDPGRVTQVGSRLALAVLPFGGKGEAAKFAETVTEGMITNLVNLRRFKVIERGALDKVLAEQSLQMSGVVDEKQAVNVGKIAGADAIVLGSLTMVPGRTKVSARVIDTETGETVLAKEEQGTGEDLVEVEKLTERVSIMIYNGLPLVEGFIVTVDPTVLYVDLGSEKGIRKGAKCIAFREGDKILHPVTGEVLGSKVTKLGELVVLEVQEKLSAVRIAEKDSDMKVGDRVVVK